MRSRWIVVLLLGNGLLQEQEEGNRVDASKNLLTLPKRTTTTTAVGNVHLHPVAAAAGNRTASERMEGGNVTLGFC